MSFNPNLDTTREDYDLAIALGYDWVARVHDGEDVPMSEYNLACEPFTIVGRHVVIREVSIDRQGQSRCNRRGDDVIRRVRLRPLPTL